MSKVSVVIPTFNRFKYLLNTIKSIKEQTHTNIEIIVVNDCSSEKEYYEYNWKDENINIIHLKQNTKEKFGYASPGFVRNKGILKATGEFIAFCDDDDIWLPNKLELQLKVMKGTGYKFSATEGLYGEGIYDPEKTYKKYNSEKHMKQIRKYFINKGSKLLNNGYPRIWTLEFLKIHNCIICSSVIVEKKLLTKINNFNNMKPPGEDYDCWLRLLEHTKCVYVKDPCVYYDGGHGDGQNY